MEKEEEEKGDRNYRRDMSKIFIKTLILFTPFISFSQEVEIKHLSEFINTTGSELNFIQTNETTAYYTSSTLEEAKYQSLIFKTELKVGKWQKGKYFHLGKSESYANISYPENDNYIYFSVIDKGGKTKIAFRDYKNYITQILNNKINLYTLLVRPNFGCSTKDIYNNVKSFSKPIFKINKKISINYKFLSNLRNDLEEPAFRKYPVLKKLKIFIEKLDKILFVNMTGSGSTIVGYFTTKKTALNTIKILNKKYKNYWCILSKTI